MSAPELIVAYRVGAKLCDRIVDKLARTLDCDQTNLSSQNCEQPVEQSDECFQHTTEMTSFESTRVSPTMAQAEEPATMAAIQTEEAFGDQSIVTIGRRHQSSTEDEKEEGEEAVAAAMSPNASQSTIQFKMEIPDELSTNASPFHQSASVSSNVHETSAYNGPIHFENPNTSMENDVLDLTTGARGMNSYNVLAFGAQHSESIPLSIGRSTEDPKHTYSTPPIPAEESNIMLTRSAIRRTTQTPIDTIKTLVGTPESIVTGTTESATGDAEMEQSNSSSISTSPKTTELNCPKIRRSQKQAHDRSSKRSMTSRCDEHCHIRLSRQTCSTCQTDFDDAMSFFKHIQRVHVGMGTSKDQYPSRKERKNPKLSYQTPIQPGVPTTWSMYELAQMRQMHNTRGGH